MCVCVGVGGGGGEQPQGERKEELGLLFLEARPPTLMPAPPSVPPMNGGVLCRLNQLSWLGKTADEPVIRVGLSVPHLPQGRAQTQGGWAKGGPS